MMDRSILVIGPNPAFDLTYTLTRLTPGQLNRALDVDMVYAGKGWNVCRQLSRLEQDVTYLSFHFQGTPELPDPWITPVLLPAHAELRVNTKIRTDESTTELNSPSKGVTEEEVAAFSAAVSKYMMHAHHVVITGSFPVGLAPQALIPMIADAPLTIDLSGAALATLAPHATTIKINAQEYQAWQGRTHTDTPHIQALFETSPKLQRLIITDGPNGAYWHTRTQRHHILAPQVTAQGVIGAGDSFLAGLLVGLFDNDTTAMRLAAAAAAEAIQLPGTDFGTKDAILNRAQTIDIQ